MCDSSIATRARTPWSSFRPETPARNPSSTLAVSGMKAMAVAWFIGPSASRSMWAT